AARLRLVHPRQYWWAGEQMAPQSDSGFLLRAGSGLVQQQMNLFSACNKSYAMGLSGSLVGVLTH
ncbi:MAG: hypothetical protein JSS43_18945, partial [Proteobacteria bacterium]|nr:hypothetical protein [Pseudomonadota bacterium]